MGTRGSRRQLFLAGEQPWQIAERAYQIWDEEGRLLGRDKEHWAQARRDLGLSDDVAMPPLQPEATKPESGSADQLVKDLLAEGKLDTGAVG